MMKTIGIALLIIGLIAPVAGAAQVQKPSELKFPPLQYDPPNPKDFRTTYANGLAGYVQEDHELPIFNISALINFGGLYVTQDKLGLNEIMSEILIKGGTKTREGSTIEDRINFLGGSLSFRAGERMSTLSLTVLREDLDEGLDLFFDVLMNPAFRDDALELARAGLIQRLRQANDQPGS
ncbi:MAG: insulinase family protein, partial [Acidobacteria bacterium]|nr:insulinase family protein [Acidobacteriota bacterium]